MIRLTFILLIIFISPIMQANAGGPVRVHVSKEAYMHIKADRTMIGGEIQIHDSKGALVRSLTIDQSNFFVDFFDLDEGVYTITLHRADLLIEFAYSLGSSTHQLQPNDHNHHQHHHHFRHRSSVIALSSR